MSVKLRDIIEATKLDPDFCADLLGVIPEQFHEWLNGVRPLPRYAIPELSSILGISEKSLSLAACEGTRPTDTGALAPAIWYKLRNDRLTSRDRELVGLVRKLGYYIDQLQSIRTTRARQFDAVFRTIREKVDRSQPPAIQGSKAASVFRSTTDLQQGQRGIGEWVRPALRRLGILVVESPISSSVEGCSFAVGSEGAQTPCVFANTYKTTWFRRNEIILHEVAHSIFDLENDPVALDFRDANADQELSEIRAQKFAQECLVPRSVLISAANHLGLKWTHLDATAVAALVSHTHTEQSLVLKAAFDNDLIDEESLKQSLAFDCVGLIRNLSSHALSTREYLRTLVAESPKWIAENRNTSIGQRPLRLPSAYVAEVIETFEQGEISLGKAAEMLMMDKETFRERFCPILQSSE